MFLVVIGIGILYDNSTELLPTVVCGNVDAYVWCISIRKHIFYDLFYYFCKFFLLVGWYHSYACVYIADTVYCLYVAAEYLPCHRIGLHNQIFQSHHNFSDLRPNTARSRRKENIEFTQNQQPQSLETCVLRTECARAATHIGWRNTFFDIAASSVK